MIKPVILAGMDGGLIAMIVLLVVFGIIVFAIVMLKRHSKFFKDKDKKPEEKKIVQDELKRVLEEVEDEETKKAMANFEKDKPQNENKEDNQNK